MMNYKGLAKRGIAGLLAVIFFGMTPFQVMAEERQERLPESYEGTNTEEVETQTELSQEELLQTMAVAQQSYTPAPTAPIAVAPEFSQECTVVPNLSANGRNYHVDSVTFSGTATGNNITGIKYRMGDTEEFVAIEDFTRETETLSSPAASEPQSTTETTATTTTTGTDTGEDTTAEPEPTPTQGEPTTPAEPSAPVTVDHITWSVTVPVDKFEEGKAYLPEVSYVFAESKTGEDGEATTVESTREFTATTFVIHKVGRNQKLSKIAKKVRNNCGSNQDRQPDYFSL